MITGALVFGGFLFDFGISIWWWNRLLKRRCTFNRCRKYLDHVTEYLTARLSFTRYSVTWSRDFRQRLNVQRRFSDLFHHPIEMSKSIKNPSNTSAPVTTNSNGVIFKIKFLRDEKIFFNFLSFGTSVLAENAKSGRIRSNSFQKKKLEHFEPTPLIRYRE